MKQNLVIAKPNDKLYSQFSNSNKNTQSRHKELIKQVFSQNRKKYKFELCEIIKIILI